MEFFLVHCHPEYCLHSFKGEERLVEQTWALIFVAWALGSINNCSFAFSQCGKDSLGKNKWGILLISQCSYFCSSVFVFQLVFGLTISYYQFFNQAFKMFFKFSPAVLVAFSERADLSNQAHHTTQIFFYVFYYYLAFKKLGENTVCKLSWKVT